MAYQSIEVRKLTPSIGAEIFGVDLAKPLGNQQFQEVHDALMDNLVVFFRDQKMSIDQHKDFGRRFGPLHTHPNAPIEFKDHPEILVIKADEKSKHVAGEEWHSDVSCDAEPPMGSILYLTEVPPDGGDTLFANMYRAYETLSEPIKRMLQGLTALHDSSKAHYYRVKATDRDDIKFPNAEHPVVRTHPVTGKQGLYVNRGFTLRIPQLKRNESDALLEMLYRHIETPEFQCRFKWQKNSVAFWDNRCAQHHAMFDYFPHRRYGHRVTVCGDKPFYQGSVGSAGVAPGREVGRDRRRHPGQQPAIAGAGFRLAHRRAREAHGDAAGHAVLVEDRHGHAVHAHRTRRLGEGKAVAADALERGFQRGALADAEAAQDAAALVVGTEGDPGAAERAHQHRALAIVARRLERHRALRRGRMADRHAAGAQRGEIERPALFAREAAHVRDGGVDQVIDEAHAAGQRQHLVGQPVARLARDARGVAQRDQGMEQPHHGRPRQAGLGGQHRKRRRPPAIERLQHREGAADGLDDGLRHGLCVLRFPSRQHPSPDGTGNRRARSAPARACTAPGRRA